MKKSIVLFSVLLILWIAGCTYCYLCQIRSDCGDFPVSEGAASIDEKKDTLSDIVVQAEIPKELILYFDLNESKTLLTELDKQRIDEIKKFIQENPGSVAEVTGHSDHTGTQTIKQKISDDRADFARQLLLSAGVEASRIALSGKSDNEPVTQDNSPDENAINRRAEIQIK